MRILIGMETSNTIAAQLRKRGHYVLTCDLLLNDVCNDNHHTGDIYEVLFREKWDAIIMHPTCTALSLSGNRHYAKGKPKHQERINAIIWTNKLWHDCLSVCNKVVFENPQGVLPNYTDMPKPQYIQPFQFGHPETKKTGLFIYGFPNLVETHNVKELMMTLPLKERHKIWYCSPGAQRWKTRSKTYPGIAAAIASQWF